MSQFDLILRHPRLKDFYQYWLSLCADEYRPVAADVGPTDMRPWIDNLAVLDVSVEDTTFTYVYCGQSFSDAFHGAALATPTESLPSEGGADILRADCDRVVRERRPLQRVYMAACDGTVQTWERLILPLFDGQGEVDKVIVCAYRLHGESPGNPLFRS